MVSAIIFYFNLKCNKVNRIVREERWDPSQWAQCQWHGNDPSQTFLVKNFYFLGVFCGQCVAKQGYLELGEKVAALLPGADLLRWHRDLILYRTAIRHPNHSQESPETKSHYLIEIFFFLKKNFTHTLIANLTFFLQAVVLSDFAREHIRHWEIFTPT